MALIADANGASVHHCDWRALLEVVPTCDALIVDAPYSDKTHRGHNGGTDDVNGIRDTGPCLGFQQYDRRAIGYGEWSASEVSDFVAAWSPRVAGWIVSITDDQLAPAWSAAFEAAGRYAFAWLPYVAPGSRVRLSGDGPSSWTCWIVVARPRTREMSKWGTLPGAYVLPPGQGGAMPVVGGKPLWLMEQLVKDYSRLGDLVVDPCCGAGTTIAAAIRQGRRAIGGDMDPKHAAMAARWITDPQPKCPTESEARQRVLW